MMDEIFLEDDETGLLVSNLGRVVGPTGKVLKYRYSNGYARVASYATGLQKNTSVHRLVARNFIPNPCNLPVINHKDENHCNNRVDNLEWCTQAYNAAYGTAGERGQVTRDRKGCRCARQKVVLQRGKEIREFKSLAQASKELNINCRSISGIAKRETGYRSIKGWHLPGVIISHNLSPHSITLERGNEIKTWSSYREAARCIGCESTEVCQLVKGKRFAVHGWHLIGRSVEKSTASRRITLQKGDIIRSWDSMREASKELGVGHTIVWSVSKGIKKSVKGWRLAQ